MLSGDDFLVKVRYYSIDLINEYLVSVLSTCYIERGNESHLLPDLSYTRDIIYFPLANDRFGINRRAFCMRMRASAEPQ